MVRRQPTAVTAELMLRMVVDSDRTVAVPCSLEFLSEEPYAVRATFHAGASDIEWTFARDLMLEGLQRPSGEGDVVMWPENHHGDALLLIALSSPSGQAVLECPREYVEHFLRRTFEIVPIGEEGAALDIDGCIAAILRDGLTAL